MASQIVFWRHPNLHINWTTFSSKTRCFIYQSTEIFMPVNIHNRALARFPTVRDLGELKVSRQMEFAPIWRQFYNWRIAIFIVKIAMNWRQIRTNVVWSLTLRASSCRAVGNRAKVLLWILTGIKMSVDWYIKQRVLEEKVVQLTWRLGWRQKTIWEAIAVKWGIYKKGSQRILKLYSLN